MDKLETYIWGTDTDWRVSLDERDDFESTGSEVVRHQDFDCGKRFGGEVYCVSGSVYSRRTLTLSDDPGRRIYPAATGRCPISMIVCSVFPLWYIPSN